MDSKKQQLNDLYRQMAQLTYDKCKQECEILGSCCSQLYCYMAVDKALKTENLILDVSNKRIPLLDGNNQCKAPPHLRPLCTLHICEKFFWNKEFLNAYFDLRDRINELENDIYGMEVF